MIDKIPGSRGENNPELADFFQKLGIVLTKEKQFPEAEVDLRKALSLRLLQFAPDHFRVAMTNSAPRRLPR